MGESEESTEDGVARHVTPKRVGREEVDRTPIDLDRHETVAAGDLLQAGAATGFARQAPPGETGIQMGVWTPRGQATAAGRSRRSVVGGAGQARCRGSCRELAQSEAERKSVSAGPDVEEREVEDPSVPGHDDPRWKLHEQCVELGEQVAFLPGHDGEPGGRGDGNRDDAGPPRVEAAAAGVGLDVEAVGERGGDRSHRPDGRSPVRPARAPGCVSERGSEHGRGSTGLK